MTVHAFLTRGRPVILTWTDARGYFSRELTYTLLMAATLMAIGIGVAFLVHVEQLAQCAGHCMFTSLTPAKGRP